MSGRSVVESTGGHREEFGAKSKIRKCDARAHRRCWNLTNSHQCSQRVNEAGKRIRSAFFDLKKMVKHDNLRETAAVTKSHDISTLHAEAGPRSIHTAERYNGQSCL